MHIYKEKVFFQHTDFSGVVYHARYLDFFEHGRSTYVADLGISHKQLFDGCYGEPLVFSVYNMNINFHSPAFVDDWLIIETSAPKFSGAKIEFQQFIKRDEKLNEKLLVSADVQLVLLTANGKVRRLPAELKKLLEKTLT